MYKRVLKSWCIPVTAFCRTWLLLSQLCLDTPRLNQLERYKEPMDKMAHFTPLSPNDYTHPPSLQLQASQLLPRPRRQETLEQPLVPNH